MSAYDVTIRVPDEEGLTATISAMRSSCTLRSVVSAGNSKSPTKKVAARADKLTGRDLLAVLFKSKSTLTTTEIRDAFIKAGFSSNSASPQIAASKQRGEIRLSAPNTYKRV